MKAQIGDIINIEDYGQGQILEISRGIARIESYPNRTIFVKVKDIKDGKLSKKDIQAITSYHIG